MNPTTQIFFASTLYGVMNLSAAIDSDQFGGTDRDQLAGRDRVRRILLISNNALLPEASASAAEMPGFELLAKRFDRVISYNEAIEPFHPSSWNPRPIDSPLWQRYLRQHWDLGDDDLHLIVESIQVNPAQTICRIFPDARIDVYADGLMSYGPTRNPLEPLIGSRIERLFYADLVPGLTPMLLSEWDATPTVIDTRSIKRVIAELSDSAPEVLPEGLTDGPVVILLGQYLSALGIISPAEEEDLHRQMLLGAISRGHRRVIFKPHPSAPRELADTLRAEAGRRGVDFWVLIDSSLAETFYARLQVEAVIGCFSTAMITAARFYRIPVFRTGTELMLDRLTPYHNSNRIPVTVVDATVPPVQLPQSEDSPPEDPRTRRSAVINIVDLVGAVGYVMQPALYQDHRPAVIDFLGRHYPDVARYFRRQRLGKLELPGGTPVGGRLRRISGRARVRLRRMLSGRRSAGPGRRRLPRPARRSPVQE
ncbi:MAG TPA: alpha-2,8-polysialyltransferase family protein [Microlunatus sp.]